MNKLRLSGLILLCVLFTGCVKYRVTLTDGSSFTVLGKPKHDKENGVYRYKSGGKEQTVSAGKIVSIEPSADANTWDSPGSSDASRKSNWYNDK